MSRELATDEACKQVMLQKPRDIVSEMVFVFESGAKEDR